MTPHSPGHNPSCLQILSNITWGQNDLTCEPASYGVKLRYRSKMQINDLQMLMSFDVWKLRLFRPENSTLAKRTQEGDESGFESCVPTCELSALGQATRLLRASVSLPVECSCWED